MPLIFALIGDLIKDVILGSILGAIIRFFAVLAVTILIVWLGIKLANKEVKA